MKSRRKGATATVRDMFGVTALIFVSAMVVLFIALNFNSEENNMAIDDRYQSFNTGWHLEVGERDEVVDFPVFVKAKAGESIVLSKKLIHVSQYYAVASRNYHQHLKAYVGDELVYEFPRDGMFLSNAIITDDWNMIRLDETMEGETFRIELKTGNFGFEGYLKQVYFGEDNSVIHYIRAITAFPYAMAISVLTLGIVLVVLGILYNKYNDDGSQIIAGLMLAAIGLWVTNRSKMPLLITGNSIKYYLAFLALLLESILILIYVREKFKSRRRKLTDTLITCFGIYSVIILGMVHLRSYPVDQSVPFAYTAIFFASLYLIIMLWPISYGTESKSLSRFQVRSNRIEFFATNFMVIGVVVGIAWDFVIGSDRLWTDIGALPKLSLNVYAIGQLAVHIYRSYHGVEEREVLQEKLHDSRLELMMGQIQPHFIFNTLSSIRTLIKVDPDVAYNMTYDFSNYLRANVDNVTNLEGIEFLSELEHIKSYVNIEKVRFGDRLNVEYDINVSDFTVPPLSIQPIVENAIKHGVTKKVSGGTVWLRSYENAEYNIVEIEDDGVGFSPDRLQEIRESLTADAKYDAGMSETINLTGNGSENHKSSGMRNIYLRLKEMSNAKFEIESVEGEGTKIKVFFPKE